MASPGRYVLAPAFDIVPNIVTKSAAMHPQSIGVGAAGAASTTDNALSQCGRFLLTLAEAKAIVDHVKDVVSRWRQDFSDAGVGSRDLHLFSSGISLDR